MNSSNTSSCCDSTLTTIDGLNSTSEGLKVPNEIDTSESNSHPRDSKQAGKQPHIEIHDEIQYGQTFVENTREWHRQTIEESVYGNEHAYVIYSIHWYFKSKDNRKWTLLIHKLLIYYYHKEEEIMSCADNKEEHLKLIENRTKFLVPYNDYLNNPRDQTNYIIHSNLSDKDCKIISNIITSYISSEFIDNCRGYLRGYTILGDCEIEDMQDVTEWIHYLEEMMDDNDNTAFELRHISQCPNVDYVRRTASENFIEDLIGHTNFEYTHFEDFPTNVDYNCTGIFEFDRYVLK